MRFPENVVTEEDTRAKGAGVPEKCFYCKGKFGAEHDADCVCLQRPVKIRLTIELIITQPRDWQKDMIEFHMNESSWCMDNIMEDLARYADSDDRCLCPISNVEYIGEATLEEAIDAGLKPDTERGL